MSSSISKIIYLSRNSLLENGLKHKGGLLLAYKFRGMERAEKCIDMTHFH